MTKVHRAARLGDGMETALRCGMQVAAGDMIQHSFQIGNFAVVWLLSGKADYRDDVVGLHALEPGEAFHRLPDRRHHVRFAAGSRSAFIALPGEVLAVLRRTGLPGIDAPVIRPGVHEDLVARWDRLTDELAGQSPLRLAMTAVTMQALVVDLHLRAVTRVHPHAGAIERACALLDRHQGTSLAAIARTVGLPETTFRAAFRQAVGCAPWTWRLRRRIERAQELLLADSRPIAAIADQLGFADAPTFSRRFRAVTGVSPRSWRGGAGG